MLTDSGSSIVLADGNLITASGSRILTDVHENVILTPTFSHQGCFIGVKSDQNRSCATFPVGKIRGLRFLSLYRFKLWWMTQLMGRCGKDIPFETQFLMVEVPCKFESGEESGSEGKEERARSVLFAVFLPILEGNFRASLRGNGSDELEICLESGDPSVQEFEGRRLVYVAAGEDPYILIRNSVKLLETQMQTFSHRENKKIPDMLNWFGWCTWDAFYTDVTAEGVKEGLKSLQRGGAPPKFVIIDDGWQSVEMDPTSVVSKFDDTANFANWLTDIRENNKFRERHEEDDADEDSGMGFQQVIAEIKSHYALKYDTKK